MKRNGNEENVRCLSELDLSREQGHKAQGQSSSRLQGETQIRRDHCSSLSGSSLECY